MTKLSVNVNKIATLRNTRANGIPDIVKLSARALDAGAHGITVHPRPDQRHVRPDDVDSLAALCARRGAEYNIEGNPFHGLVEHCQRVRPTQATLVPDAREAFTSNHGWNLIELGAAERQAVAHVIEILHASGCRVSLFVDPVIELMPIARQLGADRIELYTEPYAAALPAATIAQAGGGTGDGAGGATTASYAAAARAARAAGLGVNAGHDLNLDNLAAFVAQVAPDEVSIGHALIADALELGMEEAVRRYRALCATPPRSPSTS
jgi:pyridoxine 5-phosphate synthase